MQIMGYVAKLMEYGTLASELAGMLSPIMPEGSLPSGGSGGFDAGAMQGMTPVVLPKNNRKVLRDYDKHLYKLRHLVENAFLHLKNGAI